jgi:hypothetical protein
MSLPYNFVQPPHKNAHRYFRNTYIAFRKCVKTSNNKEELQEHMLQFLDASKQMHWKHHPTATYHKEEGEKAIAKVYSEFKRYMETLQSDPSNAHTQDLLDALSEIERFIDNFQVE